MILNITRNGFSVFLNLYNELLLFHTGSVTIEVDVAGEVISPVVGVEVTFAHVLAMTGVDITVAAVLRGGMITEIVG